MEHDTEKTAFHIALMEYENGTSRRGLHLIMEKDLREFPYEIGALSLVPYGEVRYINLLLCVRYIYFRIIFAYMYVMFFLEVLYP